MPYKFRKTPGPATKKNEGMTLVELLIASVLIGIVMVGVLSVDVSIKRMQESTDRGTLVTLRAEAALARMARDARMAIGDATDRGIIISPEGALTNVAFRHDTDRDPSNYVNDTWVIYYTNGANLYICEQTMAEGPTANQSSGDCTPSNATLLNSQFVSGSAQFETSPGAYVQLSLTLRALPGEAVHPLTNPEYSVSVNVRPLSHTR